MKTFRNVCKWLNIILKCLLIVVLILLAAVNINTLVQRYAFNKGIPTMFGYGSAVVVSGSMADEINVNDLVIIKKSKTYEVNDVITFYDSSAGEYVTHRIIFISDGGLYTTKGDANNKQDDFSVPYEAVVGKVVCVVRSVGKFISFMQSPAGLFAIIAAGIVIWVVLDLISGRINLKNRTENKNEQNED